MIGIEDDGELSGFKRNGAHDIEDFEQIALTCCNPIPIVRTAKLPIVNSNGEDDVILILDIEPSGERVITRRKDGEVFLRQGDRSVRLDREQVRSLEYDKNQRRFEDEVDNRSTIEDVDPETIARYKSLLNTDVSDEQALRSRGFLKDGHLTNAGILLFAKNPTVFMPWARLRILRYDGTTRGTGQRLNIVKDRTIEGPIPRMVDDAKAMISEQLRDFQFLGDDGQFKIVPEYPEFSWFEGLINAITHRNYAFSGDYIRISIFDDRMEIFSPGKLPNLVTLENMRHTRWSRNPQIARTLVEFGWVRELNEGVGRIYDEMKEFFLDPPEFTEPNNAAVLLTLKNNIESRRMRLADGISKQIDGNLYDSLNDYERMALQFVYGNRKANVAGLAAYMGRSVKVSREALKSLLGKGLVVWHGTSPNDPAQYYSLP